jgi:DNA polymerase-4
MNDPIPPRILLADADAFYVSVARLVDPAGAGRAALLIVGGSAERRGVVTSASYEARAFGVHSAMPMARAVRLCPDAMVVPVPWEACVEQSRDIKRALGDFTPAVEQASSDEFYLDMSGTERLYKGEPLSDTARRIRATVQQKTRLTVSIGGGTSKVVAKLAAGVAKPAPAGTGDGVWVVDPGAEIEFMQRFALAELPSVGPRFQERLLKFGLRRVDDVLRHERHTLETWLGEREGAWLYDRVRGIGGATVDARGAAQSISRDDTFPADVSDDAELERLLLERVDTASSDLRESGLLTRTITVKLRDADFTTRQASRTLTAAVCSTRAVYQVARGLLAKLRKARRVPARLIGVALSGLVRVDSGTQLSLLDAESPGIESERDRALSRALDQVRGKFGRDKLGFGRTEDS